MNDLAAQDISNRLTFFDRQAQVLECPERTPQRRTVEDTRFLRKNRAFAHRRLDLIVSVKQSDMVSIR